MEENKQIMPTGKDNKIQFSTEYLKNMLTWANEAHKSSCFNASVKNPQQALFIIQTGAEMGMGIAESLRAFFIVNGNITIYGVAMSKRLREHGWRIKVGEHNEKVCNITITKGDEEYSYEATVEEVKKVGSRNVDKIPKDKLYWHACSRLIRFYVPEVLGAIAYIKEEVDDIPTFGDAEVINVDSEEASKAPDYQNFVEMAKGAESEKDIEEIRDSVAPYFNDYSDEQKEEITKACKTAEAKFVKEESAPPADEPAKPEEVESEVINSPNE